jgi:16S rRNA (guanine527-N7)-methyltransferase
MSLGRALADGLQALKLQLPDSAQAKLLEFLALVDKWNRVYNLTAVREREKMLAHHVLDSLAVAPHLTGSTLLDVGSGAGLPGIPLALAWPQSSVTLLEANHKKATFLKQAAIELGLANVDVVNARVESWEAPRRYDVVISRAFSDLAEFVGLAGRHCAEGGVLAAMKGVHPYEELAQLPAPYRARAVIALTVPGLNAERHLVLVERAESLRL